MGMFDSVYAPCPACGALLEFQSKAGPCELKRYHLTSVPPAIAIDLDGGSATCDKCGGPVALTCAQVPDRVRMDAITPRNDDDDTEGWD